MSSRLLLTLGVAVCSATLAISAPKSVRQVPINPQWSLITISYDAAGNRVFRSWCNEVVVNPNNPVWEEYQEDTLSQGPANGPGDGPALPVDEGEVEP